MKRRISIFFGLSLIWTSGAHAAGGGDPFAFLQLPVDARPTALGGAYTAIGGDSASIFYNPAGLAFAERNTASFMHNSHFEGVNQEVASIAFKNGLGLGINYLSFGDIPRTTVSNQAGSGFDSFSANDLAITSGYGRRMNAFLSAGFAIKFVREKIANFTGSGFGLDLGTQIELEPLYEIPLTVGVAIQNIGLSSLKFQSQREAFPTQFRLGFAYKKTIGTHRLTGLLDINRAGDDNATLHPGVEWVPRTGVALRIGYDGRNDAGSGITTGVGFAMGDMYLRYAFVPFGDLGDSHRVSLGVAWGAPNRMPDRTARRKRVKEKRRRRPAPRWHPGRPKRLPPEIERPAYFESNKNIGG
ncbi:MAG: hypothetical protein COB53_10060 [Elusimicrobia bacterium]|nr:MAG: hypothetical protein COB53_10060 [Elusimicrobiota bacterium]